MYCARWTSRDRLLMPSSDRKVNCVCPEGMPVPRAVVIWMTPAAARDPYKDAAAAPLTTSTLSMSSELRSADDPVVVERITPSTTINGEVLLLMLVGVRSWMSTPVPG